MKRTVLLFALIVLTFTAAGCRERTDRSEGSVLLSVVGFDELPSSVSASQGPFSIGEITVRNIPKEPNGITSDLQSVEIRSYEVRFDRRDTGTRVPPPTVQGVFSLVEPNGEVTFENLPFLGSDQILSQPLRDLRDFGVDRETGTQVIVLDVSIRFFGRTLAGDDVVTAPARFTIDVVP
jgi:hypothetical protein